MQQIDLPEYERLMQIVDDHRPKAPVAYVEVTAMNQDDRSKWANEALRRLSVGDWSHADDTGSFASDLEAEAEHARTQRVSDCCSALPRRDTGDVEWCDEEMQICGKCGNGCVYVDPVEDQCQKEL